MLTDKEYFSLIDTTLGVFLDELKLKNDKRLNSVIRTLIMLRNETKMRQS